MKTIKIMAAALSLSMLLSACNDSAFSPSEDDKESTVASNLNPPIKPNAKGPVDSASSAGDKVDKKEEALSKALLVRIHHGTGFDDIDKDRLARIDAAKRAKAITDAINALGTTLLTSDFFEDAGITGTDTLVGLAVANALVATKGITVLSGSVDLQSAVDEANKEALAKTDALNRGKLAQAEFDRIDKDGLAKIDAAKRAKEITKAINAPSAKALVPELLKDTSLSLGTGHEIGVLASIQATIAKYGSSSTISKIQNAINRALNIKLTLTKSNESTEENQIFISGLSDLSHAVGNVTYTLSGDDRSKFTINSTTGQVTSLSQFNFEKPGSLTGNNTYNLTIHAIDEDKNTASVNWTVTVTNVIERAVPASSVFTATPASINADGRGTVELIIALKDKNGDLITGLKGVTLRPTNGAIYSTNATLGNMRESQMLGTYKITITSTVKAGQETYSVVLNGIVVSNAKATVTFKSGALNRAHSSLVSVDDSVIVGKKTQIKAILKDVNNNPITKQLISLSTNSGAIITSGSTGTPVTSIMREVSPGVYELNIESSTVGYKVFKATLNGKSATVGVVFTSGVADPHSSYLSASPERLFLNTHLKVTAVLHDADGNPISNKKLQMSKSSNSPANSPTLMLVNYQGPQYSFLLKETTTPGVYQTLSLKTMSSTAGTTIYTVSEVGVTGGPTQDVSVEFLDLDNDVRFNAVGSNEPNQPSSNLVSKVSTTLEPVSVTLKLDLGVGTNKAITGSTVHVIQLPKDANYPEATLTESASIPGRYSAIVKKRTIATAVTYRVTAKPATLADTIVKQVNVRYVAGHISLRESSFIAVPAASTIDRGATITATLKDTYANAITGKCINLVLKTTATTLPTGPNPQNPTTYPISGLSNVASSNNCMTEKSPGIYTGIVNSLNVGTVTYTANDKAYPSISRDVVVTFLPGKASKLKITIPDRATGILKLSPVDKGGNPISGAVSTTLVANLDELKAAGITGLEGLNTAEAITVAQRKANEPHTTLSAVQSAVNNENALFLVSSAQGDESLAEALTNQQLKDAGLTGLGSIGQEYFDSSGGYGTAAVHDAERYINARNAVASGKDIRILKDKQYIQHAIDNTEKAEFIFTINGTGNYTLPIKIKTNNQNPAPRYSVSCYHGSNDSPSFKPGLENLTVGGTCDFYGLPGPHTITIWDKSQTKDAFSTLTFNNDKRIIDVTQWGDEKWDTFASFFASSSIRTFSAVDEPVMTNVTTMNAMFWHAFSFNGPMNQWDVSKVTDMYALFSGAKAFNADISDWKPLSAIRMSSMFREAKKFNANIRRHGDKWDTSSVTNMERMFVDASSFNADIGNWDVRQVMDVQVMFQNASSFNQDLTKWALPAGVAHDFFAGGISLPLTMYPTFN